MTVKFVEKPINNETFFNETLKPLLGFANCRPSLVAIMLVYAQGIYR